MCGLLGIVSRHPIPGGLDTIRKMNRTLRHRGPDQEGVFLNEDGNISLAHNRLSILDLSDAGRQPMSDGEKRFTIAFNGEIYNHHEIQADLRQRGHPFRGRSDTEALLYAYKQYGSGCVDRLRGMFAFAVHDQNDGSVFVARDRLGIKPLYYAELEGTLIFASECKAILAYPGFDRTMDPQALSDYFSLMYIPSPKTIYQKIRKLPAGYWLKVTRDGNVRLQKYWDLEFLDDSEYGREKDIATARQELLAALEDAVKSHMESDVPLGAFLSGGVDSAAVVALMSKNSTKPVLTNTVGFSNKSYDETPQAKETADFFKTRHKAFTVKPDAVGVLEKLAWHFDEPFADSSMIPSYYVCQMARQSVTVALSGDGGDENFAGYRRYFYDRLENRVRNVLPAFLRTPVFGALGAVYPKADWLPQPLRAKTLLRNLSFPPMQGYFTSMSHFLPKMKASLFSRDLVSRLGGYDSLSVFADHWNRCQSQDPLSRVQYLDFKTYLVDDILTKMDRASMAVSLEVRVPILDHKLVEMAARIPSAWKLHGKVSKSIFKDSLRSLLPESVFTRPKSGFSIPIKEWFRTDLREYSRDTLLAANGICTLGLFQKPYVEKLLREHQSSLRDHSFPLFALLSFALWHKQFGSESSQKSEPPGAPGSYGRGL